ncbi:MAG: LapA family protein [Thermaceae bacterium]|nr:LapA family protein [Thermaceae bacterium]
MAILNGLAFLITLAVGVMVWALYNFEPGLLLGTPWGRVHVALLLAGAFVLGAAVVGMYVLASWVTYRSRLSRHGRELRQTKGELESLKKQQIQEVPVIPDRTQQ